MMTTLIDRIKAGDTEARDQALATYREILMRADHSKAGDEKAIRAAMATLGYGPDRLETDLRVLRQAADLADQAAGDTPELAAEIEAAGNAWSDYQAETKAILESRRQEEIKLHVAFNEAQARRERTSGARRKLRLLQNQHFQLFGIEAPVAQPMPSPQLTPPQDAPDHAKIKAENARVPIELPWGAADGSGTQIRPRP